MGSMKPSEEKPQASSRPFCLGLVLAQPCSVRCSSIDAAVIYAVSQGELSLHQKREATTRPLKQASVAMPPAEKPVGPYNQLQPHRLLFDAEDIFQLSRSTHPWQASAILKVTPIAIAENCTDLAASDAIQKAG